MQRKTIGRITALAVLAVLLCFALVPSVSALEAPSIERVGAAYLYNIENDKVIYEKSADEIMYPAASVKIMTALVAYEKLCERMDERISITKEMINGVSGNNIAIESGERIYVRDLFYALLLKGANDAAYVLAHVSFGGIAEFVGAMNEKARALGMSDTYYANPTGMHDNAMVTTARDTALCARAFAQCSELLEMSSVSKHVIEPDRDCIERNLYNRNAFVSKLNSMGTIEYYYKYAKGMNFGSTVEGGDSFVTLAEKEGLSYICVILGGEEDEEEHIYAFDAARELCDYALDGFGYVEVLNTKKLVYDMPVELSEETDRVMLIPSAEIKAYLPHDVDFNSEITYSYTISKEILTAPVSEGQEVGHISVYYKDELLGTVTLITQNEVKLSSFLSTLEGIKSFTQSKFFICTLIALVVVTVGFVLVNSCIRQKKRTRGRYTGHGTYNFGNTKRR